MSNLEGVVLSDYLLIQCIGKGGVADVYRAQRQGESNREVAIKVFRPSYAGRASFRDYFMIEAEKIGQLDHPNILPFLEYGEGEDLLYLVTPFVSTGTLDDLLTRVGGRLSALQVLPIVQQVCSGIQYAHSQNVVHGNMKPTNVFVGTDGRMLLTDFGIARGYDDSQQSLTRVGWGSAEYTAPEQAMGILRPSSDIYALGVLLFRLLTGIPPFSGQTPIEVLLKHVRQTPPAARELVPTISEHVEQVLRITLRKQPEERFASAEELSNAFLTAATIAPFARPFGVPTPLLPSSSVVANPHTPLPPTHSRGEANDPVTPLPPFLALPSLTNSAFVSETTSSQFTDDVALLQEPETPSPVGETTGSEMTGTRRKNFLLEEDDEKDLEMFWLADPQEWSPLASPLSKDEHNEMPLTAGEYLQGKSLISDRSPALSMPVDIPPRQKSTRKGVQKWLPIIVVALLLLGLLVSLLSALQFPT